MCSEIREMILDRMSKFLHSNMFSKQNNFYRKGQDIERILPLEEDSSISYVYRHYYGLISCCYPSHKRACNAYSL